jgi:RHH-type proline utilization regulon transcriptional repressor/proline dehydrogenase/delta 1-pyrroline-5-carboxylate dehydrogenase
MASPSRDTAAKPSRSGSAFAQSLADESVELVRGWLVRAAKLHRRPTASSQRLAGVLKDPQGPAFALGFVDRVARPEDLAVAAKNFRELSRDVPRFLSPSLTLLIKTGGFFAPVFPGIVVPLARLALKVLIGHLVIDASDKKLSRSLKRLKKKGDRLNINLLGEAVLGDQEADRRLAGVSALIARDDVDYVSVKVSSLASQLSMWAYEQTVERVVARLLPLYQQAAATQPPTFINLDMEEFKDLDMTIDVFTRVLGDKTLQHYTGGIVLQAYLPEALDAMKTVSAFATARVKAGGAALKVRVVKGANLQMEQVDAALHDWPLAVLPSKLASDTNYKRVLEWALTPQRTKALRIGVAGHNLFDLAFAHLLAKQRGVADAVDVEMLIGMAPDQADAVRETVGGLILYTPVVHPQEFDAAVGYLVRRLDENASPENFMSAVFDLQDNAAMFEREERRFREATAGLAQKAPSPNRVQNRLKPESSASETFHNEPDTDPSLAANRGWLESIRALAASGDGKSLGRESLRRASIPESAGPISGGIAIGDIVAKGRIAGAKWAARSVQERAAIMRKVAEELANRRDLLLAVMMQEAGKTLQEGDPEISEAIDFARYYAHCAIELAGVDGAAFHPARLTLVTPPWNFPVAIPAGSVLAALASGSAVVIKPPPEVRRCAAVMVEALWAAGVPRNALQLVDVEEGSLGRALVSHPGVDRIILTGGFETAKLFRSFRASLPLLAETSGKNAVVVTPNADYDAAVADIVKSAFGHAGQKCSAASLVILVGSVGSSERFRRQLIDAVTTLRVGYPENPETAMGPIITAPSPKLRAGLTELGKGEQWLIEPRQLDDSGRLWSPGVRENVKAGSAFHQTEYFGPVLGIMTARNLTEALSIQNGVDYGLTAGIHSLDPHEVSQWLEGVEAGNCYVNRGITGAIVSRQPFGGWKKSSVGPGTKAGGPHYLAGLGQWVRRESTRDISSFSPQPYFASLVRRATAPGSAEEAFALRSLASDEEAWTSVYGVSTDASGLQFERNVLRYKPRTVTLRSAGFVPVVDIIRIFSAGALAGATMHLSVAEDLPEDVLELLRNTPEGYGRLESYVVETERSFAARISVNLPERIRLLGSRWDSLSVDLDGAPEVAIWANDVTESGWVEILPFVIEQAVSMTAHRFGAPDPRFAQLRL